MLTQVKRLKQKWLSVSKPVMGDPDALVFCDREDAYVCIRARAE